MNTGRPPKLLSTVVAAEAIGTARSTFHRWCVQHRGFAVQIGGRWKVPESHLARLLSGETITSIVQRPSSAEQPADVTEADRKGPRAAMNPGSGPENGDAPGNAVRRQLLTAYFLVLGAREHGDNMPPETRDLLMRRIGEDMRQAMKGLRLYEPGGLRDAIRAAGALEEYRLLTGISPQI
jgi:hypothetical protein